MAKIKFKPADTSLLSDTDLARIQKKASDQVLAQRKKEAEAAFLEEALQRERAKDDPEEELTTITIDLPAYASHLLIDGIMFPHGSHATVTRSTATSMLAHMGQMWTLEKCSGNPNLRDYVPVKEMSVSGNEVGGLARV